MVTRLVIATLFVAATGTLFGQNAQPPTRTVQGPTRVYGVGTTTCSDWLKVAKGALPDPVQMSWVMGYLSAASLTEEVQPEYVHGFINGHCEQTPNGTLGTAAKALVVRLAQGR